MTPRNLIREQRAEKAMARLVERTKSLPPFEMLSIVANAIARDPWLPFTKSFARWGAANLELLNNPRPKIWVQHRRRHAIGKTRLLRKRYLDIHNMRRNTGRRVKSFVGRGGCRPSFVSHFAKRRSGRPKAHR